jgi:large subunit ribosomal protein L4
MLEAQFYTAGAKPKGAYALPPEFDGVVREGALYHAVRAYRNNQRQGTHATKTRSFVSGGSRKPWRQKGTGRARQGSTRAPQWVGGGIAHGPHPRSYRTDVPRKVRQLARRSALNARAAAGAIHVIEGFAFPAPRTRQLAALVDSLGLAGRKVLVLTADTNQNLYLSGRNLPAVQVMRYVDAAAYDILWADALVVEQAAIGGAPGAEAPSADAAEAPARRKGAAKAAPARRATGRAAGRAQAKAAKPAAKRAAPRKPAAKPAVKAAAKPAAKARKKKDGGDA